MEFLQGGRFGYTKATLGKTLFALGCKWVLVNNKESVEEKLPEMD